MYLRHLDWKLIFFALLGCYFVPGFLIGTVLAAVLQPAVPADLASIVAAALAFLSFLLPPVAGGWYAARRARTLPRLHIVVVAVLGGLLSLVAFHASPRAMAAYVVASVAIALLSGFLVLGPPRQDRE